MVLGCPQLEIGLDFPQLPLHHLPRGVDQIVMRATQVHTRSDFLGHQHSESLDEFIDILGFGPETFDHVLESEIFTIEYILTYFIQSLTDRYFPIFLHVPQIETIDFMIE